MVNKTLFRGAVYQNKPGDKWHVQVEVWIAKGIGWYPVLPAPRNFDNMETACIKAAEMVAREHYETEKVNPGSSANAGIALYPLSD